MFSEWNYMKSKFEKFILFIFCFYSLFFLIGSTLSPIFAHIHQYNLSAKFTELYMNSCHQQPDRSFWIFGYPIAICCRCYGFYFGVSVSTILAFFNKLNINSKILFLLLIISISDIIFNVIIKFNTGNITRFCVGIFMGILFTILLCYTMKRLKEKIYMSIKKCLSIFLLVIFMSLYAAPLSA